MMVLVFISLTGNTIFSFGGWLFIFKPGYIKGRWRAPKHLIVILRIIINCGEDIVSTVLTDYKKHVNLWHRKPQSL